MRIKPIRKNRIFCLLAGLPLPSLLPKIAQCGGGGREVDRHTASFTSLSFSPILTFDILESLKPALKLEGAL